MKKHVLILLTVFIALSVTGCNMLGSDNDGDVAAALPAAVNAPAGAAAFNGVKLSFNPTITFSSVGGTNTFTYVNSAGDTGASAFPDAGTATLTGTFNYAQNATNKTLASLTIDFTDAAFADFTLNLSAFSGFSTSITSFKLSKEDDPTTYDTQIVSGQLVPEPVATSDTDTDTGTGTATTTPDSMKGKVLNLTFRYKQTDVVPAAFPYNDDDVIEFAFSSSSMLMLGTEARSVGTPRNYPNSTETVWYDSKHDLYYALSLLEDGTMNEINVLSDPGTAPVKFYGQFVPDSH